MILLIFRCAIRNRGVVAHIILIIGVSFFMVRQCLSGFCDQLTLLGVLSLLWTVAVLSAAVLIEVTYQSYRRTEKHLLRFRRVDRRFTNYTRSHCQNAGHQLAVHDWQYNK